MNIRHNEILRDKLAAEYVLGTLKGGARRRLESWMADDAALRRAVAEWQDRLHPLAEFAPSVEPSPQLFRNIERRLDAQAAVRPAAAPPAGQERDGRSGGWFDSLAFWRNLGFASSAFAAILVAVLLVRQPDVPQPAANYVAVLLDEKANTTMVITGDPQRRELIVKVVTPQDIGADRSLQLWALQSDGTPRSLGLVAANGEARLPLPENTTPQAVPALAISLEPKGGSPNPNAPTGPVLFKGAWLRI